MDLPKDLCFHLNTYRALNKNNPEHRAEKVPAMIIHSYYKNSCLPTKAEGFADVHTVGLESFEFRGSAEDRTLLNSFLL